MQAPYVETDCTITHEGRTYESGGAFITPERAVVYTSNNVGGHLAPYGELTDWHGKKMGTFERVSVWRQGDGVMYAITADIEGRTYYGRTQGAGMIAFLKAHKHQ